MTALFSFGCSILSAQHLGTIQGGVIDAQTHMALPGVTVRIIGQKLGAVSSKTGFFTIHQVPAGVYSLQFSFIGYSSFVQPDIVVHNARISTVNVELHATSVSTEGVTVQASYFNADEATPLSATHFSTEEIRRAPGSAGDINRVLSSSASVGRIDDSRADLTIRGGSPAENAFYLNNIPVININYFPKQGASGGPISFLNIDRVRSMTFYAGGFDASHEALSGVVDIRMLDDHPESHHIQADFNMIGVGISAEGPLSNDNSYYLSATRGYLDALKGLLDQTGTPRWANVQAQISSRLGPDDHVSFLAYSVLSDMLREKDEALQTFTSDNHNQQWQNILGAEWKHQFGSDGYMSTAVAYNSLHSFEISRFPQNDSVFFDNETLVQIAELRNTTHWIIHPKVALDFGTDLRFEHQNLRSFIPAQRTDSVPNPALTEYHAVDAVHSDLFLSALIDLTTDLHLNAGVRVDHSSYTIAPTFATVALPRLSLLWTINPDWQVSAAYGMYAQCLPLGLLQYSLQNGFPTAPVEARHLIASIAWLANADTRISVEGYSKNYANMPIDLQALYRCPLDAAIADFDYEQTRQFRFDGTARAYGVEASLQRKMSSSVYLMIGTSYNRSFYTDGMGVERNRVFDNQYLVNATGGWRINDEWECSAQATVCGGNATTPLDAAASETKGEEVWAGAYLSDHLPLYKVINLRADKRFNLSSSSITVYLTILNAFNFQNVKTIEWNPYEKKVVQTYHIGILPILGVEWKL